MGAEFARLDECLLAWLGAGRWRLLGRRLRPLTLAHRELLRTSGHALVAGGALTLADLDLAAQVGSRCPREAAAWLARRVPGWRVRLRAVWLAVAWSWRAGRQWQVLREWLESCENAPAMLERERDLPGGGAGAPVLRRDAPEVLELWSRVVEAGFPAREVLEEWPAGLVRWVYETLMSREGGRKFQTAADEELMARARRERAVTEPEPRSDEESRDLARELMRALRRGGAVDAGA